MAAALLLCGLLAACGGGQKPDPAAAARAFLELTAKGDTGGAYRSAAFGFQAQLSEALFGTTARELGLGGAQIATLQVTEQREDEAHLAATLKRKEGADLALQVAMTWEGKQWRVFSLRLPKDARGISHNPFSQSTKAAAFTETIDKTIPSERDTEKLVQEAMQKFAASIREKSFSGFYSYVSDKWRSQLTETQLQRAFQSFIDQKVNLGGVADVPPIYDAPPHVTSDGLLHVGGYYPTKPFEVLFAFRFIYELPEWKLFGLDVHLRRAAGPAATPDATAPSSGAPPAASQDMTTPPPAAPSAP